ncbi:F-box family protein [Striga asiatica]|uniref:F-box family protein n=1 Tax=Striga asiatica TaxID=4170 RepID=A0A5A7QGG0_STRAF|nr:F-box family protein [Striga asiatica]
MVRHRMANRSSLVVGSFLNRCDLFAKSKSKSEFKCSDSSKALAYAESELMQSADAQLNVRFLVRHQHKETLDFSVISTDGNSFRLLHEDDEDLPRNLLSVLGFGNYGYDVFGCCGSWIWLVYQQIGSMPQDLLWDMETDTCRFRCPPSPFETINNSVWASGFGFDPSAGHYKLVRCWVDRFEDKYAEVFSLGTSSWKAVHCPYDFQLRNSWFLSIHINGFYYWIVQGCNDILTIMSFDFANDQFHALIPLPKKEKLRKLMQVALVEFEGSLAAIYLESEVYPIFFEFWAWNARGSFWSLVSTFDIPAADAPCTLLNLYNNDKLFLKDSKGDLLLYDHDTRRLENFSIPIDRKGSAMFFPYVKSSVGPSSSI